MILPPFQVTAMKQPDRQVKTAADRLLVRETEPALWKARGVYEVRRTAISD